MLRPLVARVFSNIGQRKRLPRIRCVSRVAREVGLCVYRAIRRVGDSFRKCWRGRRAEASICYVSRFYIYEYVENTDTRRIEILVERMCVFVIVLFFLNAKHSESSRRCKCACLHRSR